MLSKTTFKINTYRLLCIYSSYHIAVVYIYSYKLIEKNNNNNTMKEIGLITAETQNIIFSEPHQLSKLI